MGAIFSWVASALTAKKVLEKPSAPATTNITQTAPATAPAATPAAVAQAAPNSTQETGAETTQQAIKRRAKGKQSLTIGLNTNTSGTGGTGLNL